MYEDIINNNDGGEFYDKYGVKSLEEFEKKFPGYLPYYGDFGDDDDIILKDLNMFKNKIKELCGLIGRKLINDNIYEIAKLQIELDNILKKKEEIEKENEELKKEYDSISDEIKKIGILAKTKENEEIVNIKNNELKSKLKEIEDKKILIILDEIKELNKEIKEYEDKEPKPLSTLCKIMFCYENVIKLHSKLDKLYKDSDKRKENLLQKHEVETKLEEYKKFIDSMELENKYNEWLEAVLLCLDSTEKTISGLDLVNKELN